MLVRDYRACFGTVKLKGDAADGSGVLVFWVIYQNGVKRLLATHGGDRLRCKFTKLCKINEGVCVGG